MKLAERVARRASERLSKEQREFIEQADMFFMATCDHRELPTCSYKGGDPGFVTVLDDGCIAFPNYDGNGKYQSKGNLLKNPNVGLLFVDFVGQARLRLQGVVSIDEDDELMAKYEKAQFIVRVALTRCIRTARGMCISTIWWSGLSMCRARTRARRRRSGSGSCGSICRRAIRRGGSRGTENSLVECGRKYFEEENCGNQTVDGHHKARRGWLCRYVR